MYNSGFAFTSDSHSQCAPDSRTFTRFSQWFSRSFIGFTSRCLAVHTNWQQNSLLVHIDSCVHTAIHTFIRTTAFTPVSIHTHRQRKQWHFFGRGVFHTDAFWRCVTVLRVCVERLWEQDEARAQNAPVWMPNLVIMYLHVLPSRAIHDLYGSGVAFRTGLFQFLGRSKKICILVGQQERGIFACCWPIWGGGTVVICVQVSWDPPSKCQRGPGQSHRHLLCTKYTPRLSIEVICW